MMIRLTKVLFAIIFCLLLVQDVSAHTPYGYGIVIKSTTQAKIHGDYREALLSLEKGREFNIITTNSSQELVIDEVTILSIEYQYPIRPKKYFLPNASDTFVSLKQSIEETENFNPVYIETTQIDVNIIANDLTEGDMEVVGLTASMRNFINVSDQAFGIQWDLAEASFLGVYDPLSESLYEIGFGILKVSDNEPTFFNCHC